MAETLPTRVPSPTTTPASSSLLYIVDSPYSNPADNATTIANAVTKGHGLSNGLVVGVSGGVMTATDLKLDDLATPDDNTDLNATTTRHGLLPKLPGGTTNFLREDGTWAAPSGGSDPFIAKLALASDVSTGANTTPVNVTGLTFNFVANSKYIMELYAVMQSAANTTGYGLQWDVSAAVTLVTMQFFHQLANTGTLSGGSSIADDASTGVSSGIPTANTNLPLYAAGILISGANTGSAQLRLRSEVSAVSTIKAGSLLRVMKLA